jgi:hypothetical protein
VANGGTCDALSAVGAIGGTACFDGNNDLISLTPHLGSLAFPSSGDFSVLARFQPGANGGTIFSMMQTLTENPGIRLYDQGGTIWGEVADYRGLDVEVVSLTSPNRTAGIFHHAALTYDGGVSNPLVTLVVDGIQQGLGTAPFSFVAGDFTDAAIGRESYIGDNNQGLVSFFNGLIDEVMVLSRTLPQDVVVNQYCALEADAGRLTAEALQALEEGPRNELSGKCLQ